MNTINKYIQSRDIARYVPTDYLGDCLNVLWDHILLKAAQLKGKKKKNQIKMDM